MIVFAHHMVMLDAICEALLRKVYLYSCYFENIFIITRDLPGGKRILRRNIRAQHTTFSKAIKAYTIKI